MSNKIRQTQKKNSSEPRKWQKAIMHQKAVRKRQQAFGHIKLAFVLCKRHMVIDPKDIN